MLDIQKRFSSSFFALLSLPSTAMGFALCVQISALSWILNTEYGFDVHQVGIVWAAGPLAGILAQPIVGFISDNVWFLGGRRRPFILAGGLLAGLMLLALPNLRWVAELLGTGPEGLMGIAIAVALTFDLAINVSFNPTRSIIADVTDDKHRTTGFTWMQTVSGTFGVLAYVIGAYISNYALIYTGFFLVLAFSLIPPFFITEPRQMTVASTQAQASVSFGDVFSSLLPLVGFLVYGVFIIAAHLMKLPEQNIVLELACLGLTAVLAGFIFFRSAGKETDLWEFQKILAAHAFTWWGVQTMFVYMFAYAKSVIMGYDVNASLSTEQSNEVGTIVATAFLVLNAVGAILPATILGPLTSRFGRVRVHTVSVALMAVGYLLILLFGQSKIMLYLLMGVVGIGWASTISLPFAIMSVRVDQRKMGLYMGIFNLSVVLPQLVASFKMGSIINEAPDKSVMFVISAVTLAVSALLWLFVREHKGSSDQVITGGGGH